MNRKAKFSKIFITGIVAIFLGLGTSVLSYALKNSSPVKIVLNVINNNDRIAKFLENPIKINNISEENVKVLYDQDHFTKSEIRLKLTGLKKASNIVATLWKQEDKYAVVALAIEANGSKEEFINLSLRTNVFDNEELARKSELNSFSEILSKVVKQGGYFILTRSRKNNDYMQVGNMKNQEGACLFLEYSEGFTSENKKIYRAEGDCLNQNKVLQLLYSYASGSDLFKKEIRWRPLKKIETDGNGAEQFIF